jgi:hypothetical protein
MIRASMTRLPPPLTDAEPWEAPAGEALRAALDGDVDRVRGVWPRLLRALADQPLLYVALGHGGNPRRIAASRDRQQVIRRLLTCLPRLGLLTETCRLLETAQLMEARHPAGPGAITEFDGIFEVGCKAVARCLALSSTGKKKKGPRVFVQNVGRAARKKRLPTALSRADEELADCLEQLVEVLLRCWLRHSRGVRLSVLETVSQPQQWRQLKEFIQRYGGDLFTQRFMNLANLRGILHRGVPEYLQAMRDEPDADGQFRLLAELDGAIAADEAAHWLGVAIEAVVENYAQYIDYNSITTQSDRGDMLYTLLDFLRLAASYDRLAWNLRPVLLVHEVLVRCGREGAAEIWRRAVAERTAPMADEHLKRFERRCKKYGMRLPSVAERLGQRFVMPLEIDRLCALLRPAVEGIREKRPSVALRRLQEQIDRFTATPPGSGYELPEWLQALNRELEQVRWRLDGEEDENFDLYIQLPQLQLSPSDIRRQIRELQ